MSKKSQITLPAVKLADVITPRIQKAFEAKCYLFAAWDTTDGLADAALQDDEEKKRLAERTLIAFREAACIVDDILDNAIGDAAQKAANEIRGEKSK